MGSVLKEEMVVTEVVVVCGVVVWVGGGQRWGSCERWWYGGGCYVLTNERKLVFSRRGKHFPSIWFSLTSLTQQTVISENHAPHAERKCWMPSRMVRGDSQSATTSFPAHRTRSRGLPPRSCTNLEMWQDRTALY